MTIHWKALKEPFSFQPFLGEKVFSEFFLKKSQSLEISCCLLRQNKQDHTFFIHQYTIVTSFFIVPVMMLNLLCPLPLIPGNLTGQMQDCLHSYVEQLLWDPLFENWGTKHYKNKIYRPRDQIYNGPFKLKHSRHSHDTTLHRQIIHCTDLSQSSLQSLQSKETQTSSDLRQFLILPYMRKR
jgi:hypothetical protein